MARRTKRLWTDEEKRSICFQTTAPGVSVARVALRYAVNANLIFKWLCDARYAPDPALAPSLLEEARFLPVEIVAEAKAPMAFPAARECPAFCVSVIRSMRPERSKDDDDLE
jgi:transposase